MARLDKISIVGLLLGLGAILAGQLLEGGHVSSLIQPTAFLIVMGGTLGAVMLQSPLNLFIAGLKMLRWIFIPPGQDRPAAEEIIHRIISWSLVARREGLLALEGQLALTEDAFQAQTLQLLVDGTEPGVLRETMEVRIDSDEQQLKLAAKVWEAAGGYAPTIGILGAVMGLIHVMENLTDPSKLGAGIAVAFVATIYGVGLANLVFLPVAKKLLFNINQTVSLREMYLDGIIGIANGDNPRVIEARLRSYLV